MLKLISKPITKLPPKLQYTKPFNNQRIGVELTMCMNINNKTRLSALECGVNERIVVLKEKPRMLFNPSINTKQSEPEEFTFDENDHIIYVCYTDYLGNERTAWLVDNDKQLTTLINQINEKEKHAN